ncbi:hypothetical protein FACS189421_07710 [Bacteroidia bacterium]|nr:hypothetical protein FACS189421_07710 [Bacteroidia bacterium]
MYEFLFNYYKERVNKSGNALSLTKKKIYSIGTIRLLVVLGTILAAWLLRSSGTGIICLIIFIGIFIFLALLLQYNRFQKKKDYLETSIRCDENELKGFKSDFSAFDGASEKVDPGHFYSLDLDIFGNHSLFQSINRTCTNQGKNNLIEWFEKPLRESSAIEMRQEAIGELSKKPDFIHHFQVLGLINPGKNTDYQEIKDFVRHPDFIFRKKVWKMLSWVIPVLWLIGIVLLILSVIPGTILVWMYIITLLISEMQAKNITLLQQMTGKKVSILQSYSELILTVEEETFQTVKLKELQSIFLQGNRKASGNFKKLAQLAGELEQRANLVIHLLLNPLMLWDIRKSIQLEEWKHQHGKNLLQWIEALGKFDAYCSLGTFTFNHPDYTFPKLTENYFEMKGEGLGHPLMNREVCVKNPVTIDQYPFFLIITGANMAGKSTYLRTIGVNFVLACLGAPVCAKSLILYPAKLVTSLRTSDSLNDNESYFFAELKRLKMIIDELHSGEKLFIILDEILKGTNSVDKQKGSLALVQQLIHLQTCGIIATHDLLLGSLEKEFPENIKNYRFEADIKNNELSFSYQLREGIAQNMNASFLMQKMGITMGFIAKEVPFPNRQESPSP